MARDGARSPASVYDALAGPVLAYFRSCGMRDPEALTGDVFVSVVGGLGRFEGDDAALRRWVFTIAHRRRVDEIRRQSRRPETPVDTLEDRAVEDSPGADPDLLDALETLTPDQREVIVLRFVADLPVATVARMLRRRPGAVKMLQARGLESLRKSLGDRDLLVGSDDLPSDG